MNYGTIKNMNFDELRRECVRRGILDNNNNHVPKRNLEDIERRQRTDAFIKQNNLTHDEFLALTDLAMEDPEFGHILLKALGQDKP